jgi:hypothetical protein
MILLKNNRTTRTDDINAFNKLRKTFADITDKHANQRKDSTLRSSIGNRVHFKPDILADDSNRLNNQYYNNNNANNSGLSALGQPKYQSNQNDYNNNSNSNVNNSAISALVSGVVGQPKNQVNQNDYNNNNNVNTGAISALVSSVVGKTKNQSNQNTNNYSNKRDDNRKLDERYKNIHFKMFIDKGCRGNTGKFVFKMFIYYYKLLGLVKCSQIV